jgi:hypothetical protein
MDEEIRQMLEEAIKDSFKDLKELEAGSEQHLKQVGSIEKLYELKIKEDEIAEDSNSKAMQRGIESEKYEAECLLRSDEAKQSMYKMIFDIGKTALLLIANGAWIRGIMNFETTGVIATKAFGFIPKPKIF